jgi:hypothetical protein
LLQRRGPKMALLGSSEQGPNWVGFGAKRTYSDRVAEVRVRPRVLVMLTGDVSVALVRLCSDLRRARNQKADQEHLNAFREQQSNPNAPRRRVYSGTPALRIPSKKSFSSFARLKGTNGRSVPEIV